jgi:hypothetical protein
MKGFLDGIQTLRLEIQEASNLTEEEVVIITHLVGCLHSELLERVEVDASRKRKGGYKKRFAEQKPSYYVEENKVCQRCYNKFKKNKP